MSKIISPVQTVEELIFIKKNITQTCIFPLDLSTYLYCKKNKIRFIDPLIYSNNQFHTDILKATDSILQDINVLDNSTAFEKEFIAVCRFYLHQLFFIKFLLQKIIEENSKVEFKVSGFDKKSNFLYSEKNYSISEIVVGIFPERTSSILMEENKTINNIAKIYVLKKTIKVDILIPSLGYNFKRLSQVANMLGLKVGAFQFSQTSFSQKTVYMLRKVKPLEVNTSLVSLKVPDYISWLDNLGGIESDLLRKRILEALPFLNEEFGKCLAISDAVDKLKPKLTASFATRGYLGSILDTNNLTTNSVCIPHGTVTAKRTDFDFSYRSSIADAVFTGKMNYLALQSKIAQEAYYELKPEGKDLLCGNLIFNEGKNRLVDEKGIILYAVTQKIFMECNFMVLKHIMNFIVTYKIYSLLHRK